MAKFESIRVHHFQSPNVRCQINAGDFHLTTHVWGLKKTHKMLSNSAMFAFTFDKVTLPCAIQCYFLEQGWYFAVFYILHVWHI